VALAMAFVMYLIHWNHWLQLATTFLLVFPFGRRRFFAKSWVTVRIEVVGAMVYDARRGKLGIGYPLMDGILFQPGGESSLRSAFVERGYTVT
jgi:hypothetical protein